MPVDDAPVFGPGVAATLEGRTVLHFSDDDGVALLRPADAETPPGLLILHQAPPDVAPLLAEAERLRWLDGRGPAPAVLGFGRADDGSESVALALGAQAAPASHGHPMGPEALLEALSGSLRALHELEPGDEPIEADESVLLAEIHDRVERGLIAEVDDGPYGRRSPENLVEVLAELLAASEPGATVVVHGALTTARVWFDPQGDVTFTSWRRAGVGDRHLDLAAAAALVTDLHGAGMIAPLFDMYGLGDVDLLRLNAFQLMAHLLS